MIALRNFTKNDVSVLNKMRYPNQTPEDIMKMIDEWDSKLYDNRYFEMFAVVDDNCIVGMVSLFQHTETVISDGIEIFAPYCKRGYGFKAVSLALEYARSLGYKIAVAPVRIDNNASVALHKKLGFEIDHEFVNRKGNAVYFFIKSLS